MIKIENKLYWLDGWSQWGKISFVNLVIWGLKALQFHNTIILWNTDYGRPLRKSPSKHGPNLWVGPKHILSAPLAQIFRFLWFMPSLVVHSPFLIGYNFQIQSMKKYSTSIFLIRQPKFLVGPNFLATKFLRDQKRSGFHTSYQNWHENWS